MTFHAHKTFPPISLHDDGVVATAATPPPNNMAPLTTARRVQWNGAKHQDAVDLLREKGKMIVTPTKVGYIIMVSDFTGLQRKFKAKQRALNKPGVVLCSSMSQLNELAELNDEIKTLYQSAWDNDILLGCILPWKATARRHIPGDGSESLMMDRRGTSCFVIKYGAPSELITRELWDERGKIVFASSANPTGKGNSGRADGIGARINNEADLVIAADGYVRGIQPGANEKTRYEQGVMVSMVDADGRLVPEQRDERSIHPGPVVIRRGLDIDRIMPLLSTIYLSWDYRQGTYY